MKIISCIFCILILCLNSLSTIKYLAIVDENIDCCCEENCSFPIENKKSANQENCNGFTCNPFATCCAGLLDLILINTPIFNKPINLTEHQFIDHKIYIKQLSFDFWQPPKLV